MNVDSAELVVRHRETHELHRANTRFAPTPCSLLLDHRNRIIALKIIGDCPDFASDSCGKSLHLLRRMPNEIRLSGQGGRGKKVENHCLAGRIVGAGQRLVKKIRRHGIQRPAEDDHVSADEQPGRLADKIAAHDPAVWIRPFFRCIGQWLDRLKTDVIARADVSVQQKSQ